LLPNVYVAAFAILGVVFHVCSGMYFDTGPNLVWGAALGGGLLYAVRVVANWHYKTDTLGLGDVKLMTAAGLWLGIDDILPALIIGAFAGILHGIGVAFIHKRKNGEKLNLSKLEIPAGPGFIVGIVIVALAKFFSLPHLF